MGRLGQAVVDEPSQTIHERRALRRRKGLQDSKNRRAINADDKLRPVFGGKSQVSMFDMTKLVSRHMS